MKGTVESVLNVLMTVRPFGIEVSAYPYVVEMIVNLVALELTNASMETDQRSMGSSNTQYDRSEGTNNEGDIKGGSSKLLDQVRRVETRR